MNGCVCTATIEDVVEQYSSNIWELHFCSWHEKKITRLNKNASTGKIKCVSFKQSLTTHTNILYLFYETRHHFLLTVLIKRSYCVAVTKIVCERISKIQNTWVCAFVRPVSEIKWVESCSNHFFIYAFLIVSKYSTYYWR